MKSLENLERARALLRAAVAAGLLPEETPIDGEATPMQIVEAAMAGTLFYAGAYAPGGTPTEGAILADIHPDDLTWSVMLQTIEEDLLDLRPSHTRSLLERLIDLKREIQRTEEHI